MDEDDFRACDECGIVEHIADMHDDGENDPICYVCHQAYMGKMMRMYAGYARFQMIGDQDYLGLDKHSPFL